MARERYENFIIDNSGNAIVGASATVYVADTGLGTPATLYTSAGGALTNPVTTDTFGKYFFYADDGLYDIKLQGAGLTTNYLYNVIMLGFASVEKVVNKGAANGYCSLNSSSKVPYTNLPLPILETDISFSDTTSGNTSITKHGYAPKLNNNAGYFLNGQGAWAVPGLGATSAVRLNKVQNTRYRNDQGKPVFLVVTVLLHQATAYLYVDSNPANVDANNAGSLFWYGTELSWGSAPYQESRTCTAIILPNYYYKIYCTGSISIGVWAEYY